jgi:hypothetical protein
MSSRLRLNILVSSLMALCLVNFPYEQDSEKLKDGKYKVKFEEKYGGAKYVILLKGDAFTVTKGGQETKGRIDVNANCILVMDYLESDSTNAV